MTMRLGCTLGTLFLPAKANTKLVVKLLCLCGTVGAGGESALLCPYSLKKGYEPFEANLF